jgi:DNA-binding transcriptional LysR family regulator
MEIKWLEDFIALAHHKSFSRAADFRNLTQSGFSRRIQSLENWVGAPLVDRSTYPPTLSSAGLLFKDAAQVAIEGLTEARSLIRAQRRTPGVGMDIAAGHSIALDFIPKLLTELAVDRQALSARVIATNGQDALELLSTGNCELVMAYDHPELPITLDPERYISIVVGKDILAPVSLANEAGKSKYRLDHRSKASVPLLGYSASTFFGRCVQIALNARQKNKSFHLVYETDMAEILKRMVLQGHGMAWLPFSAVSDELSTGKLVPAGDADWWVDLTLKAYRDVNNRNAALETLWTSLQKRNQTMQSR